MQEAAGSDLIAEAYGVASVDSFDYHAVGAGLEQCPSHKRSVTDDACIRGLIFQRKECIPPLQMPQWMSLLGAAILLLRHGYMAHA